MGILVGTFFIYAACGGGGGGGGSAMGIAQIDISPSPVNLVGTGSSAPQGETVQLAAVGKNAAGQVVGNVTATWQSLDPAIVTIDSNGLATGVAMGVTTIKATLGSLIASAPAGVVGPNSGSSNIAISGTAKYEDKPFSIAGFTGAVVPTPIRGAIINVIAIDGFVTMATGKTGEDGSFGFAGLNNSARRSGFYIQIPSKTASDDAAQVEIRNNSTDRALYAMVSLPHDDSKGSSFFDTLVAGVSDVGGAFNLFDVFLKSNQFTQKVVCPPSNTVCVPPLLSAFWEKGGTTGTFYDDQQDAIFILGATSDPDEYDDTVVAHEYGHFVLSHFSHDQSPGGSHVLSDNKQDIRLSWSEGWASFFSSAVRNDPVHLDTTLSSTFSFEIEQYTSPQSPTLSSATITTTNEIAVAGVLWDVFDAPPADTDSDPLLLGFTPLWEGLLKIQKSPTLIPATMESFWIQFSSLSPASSSPLQSIMTERKIELFADAGETAGESALVVNGASQHHTLYRNNSDPVGDEDMIPFSVSPNVTYTLETLNLTNGADTFLFVSDSLNSPISGLESDNRSQSDLSSLIKFVCATCTGTTTFNAHVKRSPAASSASGLLGSYDIRLTSP